MGEPRAVVCFVTCASGCVTICTTCGADAILPVLDVAGTSTGLMTGSTARPQD